MFSHCLLFYERFKIHSGNRLIVVWSHVLDLHMELCVRSIDFCTDFHVGYGSLWALNENTNTTSLKYVYSLSQALIFWKFEWKSHIAAAWQCSKHSPFAQIVNKIGSILLIRVKWLNIRSLANDRGFVWIMFEKTCPLVTVALCDASIFLYFPLKAETFTNNIRIN